MKSLIEEKAQIKIRKGYDKYLEKTLKHFNITKKEQINNDIAYNIVKFINSANSILSESFYILQKNLEYDDYIDILNEQKNRFINSSYKNTNRKAASKRNGSNYSRGYSGYTEINGQKYYCRSSNEFIYINYLIKNNPNSKFEMEEQIYHINNESYKPDIFEYVDNKLIRIYEVKDSLNKFNIEKYIQFEKYCKSNNIEFVKLYKAKDIIRNDINLKKQLEQWKKQNLSKDNFSLNNAMLGVKHKQSTKDLISKKAKERFQDEDYLEAHRKRQKELMANPEVREKLSKSRLKFIEENRKIKNLKDPFEKRICVTCGDEFEVRKSNKKQTCKKFGCEINYKLKNGWVRATASKESLFKTYQQKMLNYYKTIVTNENINIDEISYDSLIEYVKKYKVNGNIPEKFGMSSKNVIKKYFDNFENLKIQIKAYVIES